MKLRRKTNRKDIIKAKIRGNIFAWLIMAIPLVLFTFFVWYPISFNVALSFFNNEKFESFVGFNNYVAIFQDQYLPLYFLVLNYWLYRSNYYGFFTF